MTARIAGEGIGECSSANELARAARTAARSACAGLSAPSVVFAFASGGAQRLDPGALLQVAREIAGVAQGASVVLAETTAIVAGSGEREGAPGVSALALSRDVVRCKLSVVAAGTPRSEHRARMEEGASARVDDRPGVRPKLTVAFLAPAAHTPEALTGIASEGLPPVVGAGTSRLVAVRPGEGPVQCDAALVSLVTSLGVAVTASPAARLLTPWMKVTGMDGPFLLSVDGTPTLDVLTRVVEKTGQREPLFFALKAPREGVAPLLRTVGGVDPARGAVAVGDVLPPDAEVAIAVRDPSAARNDLSTRLRTVAREMAGGIPAAALMLTCAGRGASLYGHADVDAGIFRGRFPSVPVAGMHSSFELAPWGDRTRVHLFTAVSAVFFRPS